MVNLTLDRITIENLEVYAHHGVLSEEKTLGQKFFITAMLDVDTQKAGRSDGIEATVHYGEVCHFIHTYVQNCNFNLLEALAQHLADELLLTFSLIQKLSLTIKKPWAPIGLPLDFVSLQITRKWHTVYLSLGSNMGDKNGYLQGAIEAFREDSFCQVEKLSSFLLTKPYGYVEQDDFLNACIKIKTLYSPQELLGKVQEIEHKAGRKREGQRWGPRTLDIDILLFDDIVKEEESLCLPHIELHKRTFVLRPLEEIAPYLRHPVRLQTVKEMLEALNEEV